MWTIIFFTSWQCSSFVMGNDDWLSHLSDESQPKCEKSPPNYQKMKNSFLYYIQLLMIGRVISASNVDRNPKKMKGGPLCHQKKKCLVLDYVQLLIISRVISVTKGDWNVEKDPLSHQKMKYSFLYYTQLLIIRQVIWVMKVDQNAKKWHVASVRVLCCFSLGLLLFLSWSCVHPTFFCYFSLGLLYPPPPDGKVGIRVAEKFKFFRFMFNKFQPKDNSVQSLLHLLAMQLICDGQWTNWFTLHFYNL